MSEDYVEFNLKDLLSLITEKSESSATKVIPELKSEVKSELKSEVKRPKRCQMADCKVKIGLTDPACKCSGLYCCRHRFADDHSCTFDYKGEGMNRLKSQLTEVRGVKVDNI